MIIKNTASTKTPRKWWLPLLGAFLLIAVVGGGISLWKNNKTNTPSAFQKGSSNMPVGAITCDAEKVDGTHFIGDDQRQFSNGSTQSSEKARSGTKSSKINAQKKYGIGYVIKYPQPNDRFRISVWQYKAKGENGVLTVSADKADDFYKESSMVTKKDDAGWELLQLNFVIPSFANVEQLKVYVYQKGDSELYLDDLKIEKLSEDQAAEANALQEKNASFELEIAEKWMQKLKAKRKQAFERGLLVTEDDDWVKGKIVTDSLSSMGEVLKVPVKLRLKGDWLDHLEGSKWSYRIQVKDPHAWNRLKTFSIQSSSTRGHLDEWVYHQWLRKEDVLSPRYDFIQTTINGSNLGVYAYEEHFDKQLPEFMKRREGVIVRFTEDGFWAFKQRQIKAVGYFADNHFTDEHGFKATKVKAFKEGRMLQSPTLRKQFEVAQNLMQQYQYGTQNAAAIFDIDRLAKYVVITDICRAYHSLRWHNQRFYYNPVTTKLEPIGFDGGAMHTLEKDAPFLGYLVWKEENQFDQIVQSFFADEQFTAKYLQYLAAFTNKEYLNNFLESLAEDLTQREQLIQGEVAGYAYQRSRIPEIAKRIQLYLKPLETESLSAFVQKKVNGQQQLKVQNKHFLPLQIIGFGSTSEEMTAPLSSPIYLTVNKNGALPTFVDTQCQEDMKYIYFKQVGNEDIISSPINAWRHPESTSPQQALFEGVKMDTNALYQVNETAKTITFPTGKYQSNQNIIIPENYTVYFEAGCELDLVNKAAFISKSPVQLLGREDAPIKIFSSDQTANGFTVLQTSQASKLHYTLFENLNTLNQVNWTLTGAVNFYEADVNIAYCSFSKNHCEDALNIIRSQFEMRNSTVSHTFADGFDADFCTGTVQDSRFYKTGNDCMDFSGSSITITNCTVQESGDKGISVGEEAQVWIKSTTVDQAVIGVASKDLSIVNIDQIDLKNCTQAFAAYRKKAEFGGAKIFVKNYTTENVKYLHQIERGSFLKLDDQVINGEL